MDQQQINAICDAGHMIFCFDLDGTITKDECPNDLIDIHPNWPIIDRIKALYKNGDTIIIYTARSKFRAPVTEQWLKRYRVPYHEIHYGKPKAHIYIDDSTVDINDYVVNPTYFEEKFRKIGNDTNKRWRNK